jgi:hypothetical protein
MLTSRTRPWRPRDPDSRRRTGYARGIADVTKAGRRGTAPCSQSCYSTLQHASNRSVISRIVAAISRWKGGKILSSALKAALKGNHDGFLIADLRSDETSPPALDALRDALDVLRDVDPRRYRRLRRDVTWIAAADHAFAHATYAPAAAAITIGSHILAHHGPRVVASYIAHEGAHARIWASGVSHSRARLAAIERRCLLEQQAFVHRLKDAAAIKRWIDDIVRSEPWKSHENDEALVLAKKLSLLEESGMSKVRKRVLRWILLRQGESGR